MSRDIFINFNLPCHFALIGISKPEEIEQFMMSLLFTKLYKEAKVKLLNDSISFRMLRELALFQHGAEKTRCLTDLAFHSYLLSRVIIHDDINSWKFYY